MRKRLSLFLASLLVSFMFILAPAATEAADKHVYESFGAEEITRLINDFEPGKKMSLGRYYTIDKQTMYGRKVIHEIIKDSLGKYSGECLTITTDLKNEILLYEFKFYYKEGFSQKETQSVFNGWGKAVEDKYGKATEKGLRKSVYGDVPYAKLIENGHVKYIYSVRKTKDGVSIFDLSIWK